MLGLRFFACVRCDTVYALPEAQRECDTCDGGRLEEITHTMDDDAYFVPTT
ncbi:MULTISPECIES: hypothetical protein [Haloferax]|uniref:hypothetical protein n=1 Tax=Haloferax TaxID=2251 RepID=UPI0012AEF35E|nr:MULTISPECIES: hypothetical protein [Haloferax]